MRRWNLSQREWILIAITAGLLSTMLFLLLRQEPPVTTYYLDASHPNASDDDKHGSLEAPWLSLDYALMNLMAGDTLLIRAGTYTNHVITLTEANSGRQDAPITITAYANESVTVSQGRTIWFAGADWWIIDGIRFDQFESFQLGLHEHLGHERTVPARSIIFRNCEFGWGKETPISINHAEGIRIEDCYFHHLRPGIPFTELEREANGVTLRYITDDIAIEGNRFEDIGSDGIHVGTQSYLAGARISTVTISGNDFGVSRPYQGILGNVGENGIDVKKCDGPITISGNWFHGFRPTTPEQDASGAHGDGLIIHGEARNVVVDGNYFVDNTTHINIAKGDGTGPQDIVVRNNIMRDSVTVNVADETIVGAAVQVRSALNVDVIHNTFINNHRYLVSHDASACFFANNIVMGGEAKLGRKTVEWTADHNAWLEDLTQVHDLLQGEHDVIAADLGLDDQYRPVSGSPVLGAGLNLGVNTDYQGHAREDPPDIGAFENQSK
jgi:hypothetical protein